MDAGSLGMDNLTVQGYYSLKNYPHIKNPFIFSNPMTSCKLNTLQMYKKTTCFQWSFCGNIHYGSSSKNPVLR
jgi:hypothetical protein